MDSIAGPGLIKELDLGSEDLVTSGILADKCFLYLDACKELKLGHCKVVDEQFPYQHSPPGSAGKTKVSDTMTQSDGHGELKDAGGGGGGRSNTAPLTDQAIEINTAVGSRKRKLRGQGVKTYEDKPEEVSPIWGQDFSPHKTVRHSPGSRLQKTDRKHDTNDNGTISNSKARQQVVGQNMDAHYLAAGRVSHLDCAYPRPSRSRAQRLIVVNRSAGSGNEVPQGELSVSSAPARTARQGED